VKDSGVAAGNHSDRRSSDVCYRTITRLLNSLAVRAESFAAQQSVYMKADAGRCSVQ
jgi:hypothetical protein